MTHFDIPNTAETHSKLKLQALHQQRGLNCRIQKKKKKKKMAQFRTQSVTKQTNQINK